MGNYVWPLATNGIITSRFGPRSDPFIGEQAGHGALDIGAPQGTDILATRPGKVIGAATSGYNGGAGLYVKIDHLDGMVSTYMHCSQVFVSVGQFVAVRQVIAKVGSTGRSTGAHLHFQLEHNGTKVDPELYVSQGDSTYTGPDVPITQAPGDASSSAIPGMTSTMLPGGRIYSSTYSRADGIIREFCYIDDNNQATLSPTTRRLSIINYTQELQQLSDRFGLLSGGSSSGNTFVNYTGTPGGAAAYDTSQLGNVERIVSDYLFAKGLNRAAVAGACGNIDRESGFLPGNVNPNGGASGLVQWRGGRKANLIAAVPDWPTNVQGQLDFMWGELNTSYYKHVLDFLFSAPDSISGMEECTKYWNHHYEVSGDSDSIRIEKALRFYNSFVIVASAPESARTAGVLKSQSGKALSLKSSVAIPTSVPAFLHGGDDCTCYSYWCTRMGYTQGQLGAIWNNRGQPHDSRNIGTLDGHLTIAMRPTFGVVGDLLRVICDGNIVFTAIMVDAKGSDATSPYGHVKGNEVSPCEWYVWNTSSTNSVQQFKGIGDWKGKRVLKVENYGSWING